MWIRGKLLNYHTEFWTVPLHIQWSKVCDVMLKLRTFQWIDCESIV